MNRTRVPAVLAAVLVVLSISCQKSEKSEMTLREETAPATSLLFKLDGKADDWARIEPFWMESGASGPTPDESSIDIKQVYFKNDALYLYVFMRFSPSIEERFKKYQRGGYVGDLFFDIDNNPKTGANAAEGHESDLYKGYEIMVAIQVGVYDESGRTSPTVSYDSYSHEGGFRGVNYLDQQGTLRGGSLIAHGPDGIEFALKLETMKLTPPMTFRAMLAEFARVWDEEGCSVGQLTLEAAK